MVDSFVVQAIDVEHISSVVYIDDAKVYVEVLILTKFKCSLQTKI